MPDQTEKIACVTGASGMIGRKIVRRLLQKSLIVRVLSRSGQFDDSRAEIYHGDLEDEKVITSFLMNAGLLFHCAAELRDESKMWDVNVGGTERLLRLASQSRVKYLCYLSSAGVVGKADPAWVDETIACNPQNAYERSKWAAEQIVARGIKGCQVRILRPTNVIDDERHGPLNVPMKGSLLDRLRVFLKGGECAHIVHAEDVAEAAIFLISQQFDTPRCFFVSCDNEPLNTFAGLWALCRGIEKDRPSDSVRPALHMPLIVPHIVRNLWRGRGNRGDVRYSSENLLSTGFRYNLGVEGSVRRIVTLQRHEGS